MYLTKSDSSPSPELLHSSFRLFLLFCVCAVAAPFFAQA